MRILIILISVHLIKFSTYSQSIEFQQTYLLDNNEQFDGPYSITYGDQLLVKGYYQHGEPAGRWIFYNYRGQKIIDGYYTNGKKNYRWTYYKNDKIISQLNYNYGILNDKAISFYSNGYPRVIQTYREGALEGEHKEFYEDSTLRKESYYRSGKLDSIFLVFDNLGNESVKLYFKEGVPFSILKSGKIEGSNMIIRGNLLNGEGTFKISLSQSTTSIPLEVRNYRNGKLNGNYKSFKYGKKYLSGNFKDDYMEGEWKTFSSRGYVKKTENYSIHDNMTIDSLPYKHLSINEIDLVDGVYFVVDDMPTFMDSDFIPKPENGRYINSITDYDNGTYKLDQYIKSKIDKLSFQSQGMVFVQFIVGMHGEVKNVKIVRGLSKEENLQIQKIFYDLPFFKPGYLKGFPVNIQFTKPIRIN